MVTSVIAFDPNAEEPREQVVQHSVVLSEDSKVEDLVKAINETEESVREWLLWKDGRLLPLLSHFSPSDFLRNGAFLVKKLDAKTLPSLPKGISVERRATQTELKQILKSLGEKTAFKAHSKADRNPADGIRGSRLLELLRSRILEERAQEPVEQEEEEEISEESFEIDQALIDQLVDFGFPASRARKALILNSSDIENAMNWLLENADSDDVDAPIPAEVLRNLKNPSQNVADPNTVRQLQEMGFEEPQIQAAAKIYGNNIDAITSYLLGERVPVPAGPPADFESLMRRMLQGPPARSGGAPDPQEALLRALLSALQNPESVARGGQQDDQRDHEGREGEEEDFLSDEEEGDDGEDDDDDDAEDDADEVFD